MTDLERILLAEDEFFDSALFSWQNKSNAHSFILAFNQFLLERYGVQYVPTELPDNCVAIVDPARYTFFLLKWP